MAEMSMTKAREIVANPSEFTKQEVKNAKAKLSDPKSTVQMAKGGYANCGASMKPTQKSTTKMAAGGMLKKPDNPGLAKLPTAVRNKMGYMKKGGYAKKK